MKFSLKQALALLLTLAMIVPLFPIMSTHVHAAGTLTVTDDKIGLSWTDASNSNGSANWSASGTTVTGTAKGYRGGFMNLSTYTVTTTLTITNNHSDDRTLSFDYSLEDGGSVSGLISGTSGSYSDTLAAGASATITLTSPQGTSTNTLTISGLALLSASNVTSTFLAPENGSYTVDGATITAQTQLTKASTEAYAMVATPATNYMFFGWWSEASQSYVSYEATASLKFASDPQLKPVFLHNTTALFGVGTQTFADLTEAANFANSFAATTKTVVLLNNGTVSGSHTIPAGITLLIPYNDANTMYGSSASCTSYSSYINSNGNIKWVQPTAYRTLTLAANAQITVNGAIELAGQHAASNGSQPYCGAPTGPLGWMKMLAGSNITLNSGANLYSWGYIQGAGTITAKSGSKVYENFQFTDFRGGTNTSALAADGLVFPINQYYVQNIEVPTIYESGAEEYIATSIFMSNQKFSATVKFMGTDGMFTPAAGSTITKDYIENRDRMQIDVRGDGSLNSMSLSLGGTKINSATFVLPITNNITINLHSGTTTVNQSVALLPGAEMTVGSEATLVISKGNGGINDYTTESFGLIVYDYDEWTYGINMADSSTVTGKYAFSGLRLRPLPYAPGRTYNRTEAKDLADAKLDVNGTVIVNGYLYTTLGGGNIMSSEKTGKIVLGSGAGNDMMTFQSNDATALVIPMQSAQLKNGDGTYESTYVYYYDDEGQLVVDYQAAPGTTYNYCATHDKWYTGKCDECASAPAVYEITFVVGTYSYTVGVKEGTTPVYAGTEALTKAADATGHYTFAGWATTENGTVLATLPAVTADTTYYAVFTGAAHDDDKIEGGKHYCSECNYLIGSCSDSNKDHKCDVGGEDMVCSSGYLTPQPGQAATCGADGWNAYYKCSCSKLYANADATGAITDLASWKTGAGKIPATGNHVDGTDKDHNCDTCGTTNIEGHTPGTAVEENRVEATCGTAGSYNSVVYCTECGEKLSTTSQTIPATGNHVDGDDKNHDCDVCAETNIEAHTNGTPVQENVVGATCEAKGSYDEVVYCTECEAEVSRVNKAIDALGHTPGEAVTENEVAADCENDGSYDTVVYCTVCDEELSRETTSVDATGHAFENGTCHCGYKHGWVVTEDGKQYYVDNVMCTGWTEIDGAWYYLDPETGYAATGTTRVPYPTVAINGNTYAPDQETMDYCESKDIEFIDAETALFFFGDDGKFMSNVTGFGPHSSVEGAYSYIVNGMFPWHYGLVELDGDYYYFIGDETNGGNIMATGDVYISRNTTDRKVVIGGVYTFGADGKLGEYDGITDVDGTLRYYEDAQLMLGKGLTKVDGNYYYVRSNGALVVDTEYWVANVNEFTDIPVGTYTFDESGVMQIAHLEKNGVVAENGGLFYYENGKLTYAGLIEYDGGWIYVRSNGQLATGRYWVTTTNDNMDAGWYEFDENGMMLELKNGIVDGYYYIDGSIAYAAGLIEIDGDYYYVRSNGEVVMGKGYWITTVNETGIKAGYYEFDADGKMILPENYGKNGIIDGYYYVDGEIAYAAGLIEYEGDIYYVRSNGQVATGKYWATNINVEGYEPGYYNFGEDGKLIAA